MMKKQFADRLISLRQEKKISQDEFAKRLGISRSAIGMYEQGRREPDFETMDNIAQFFNVSYDYLLGSSNERGSYRGRRDEDLADLGNRLSPEEFALLTAFRSADREIKARILAMLGVR